MRKYWVFLQLCLARAFIYRAASFVWFLCDISPSLVIILFWLAAFQTRTQIAGYSLNQMVLYYLGTMFIATIVIPYPETWLSEQIRSGSFSLYYLLRPVNLFWDRLIAMVSWRIIRSAFIFPVLLIAFYFLNQHLPDFSLSFSRLVWLVLSLILSFLIQLNFKICLGLFTIWFEESNWLFQFFEMLVALFGGRIIPFNLLPQFLQSVGAVLPFKYFIYFPLTILVNGALSNFSLVLGIASQLFWLAISFLAYRLVFGRAVKNYTAFGG